MENKIKKFIRLSKEFTVDSKEVYGDFPVISSSNCYYTIDSQTQTTKLERFTKVQQDKVEKAERYEEYLTLQADLLNYYNALTKLK